MVRLARDLGPDRRPTRPILFVLLIAGALAWILAAYRPGKPASLRMTLADLEKTTRGLPFLTYWGVDGNAHRFEAPDGRVFLVDRSALAVPMALPARAGIGLFVKVEAGRLWTLRPEEAAALEHTVGREPFSFPPADDPDPHPHRLPVLRHAHADEPAVLILSSDGDWSKEDLGRLNRVLAAWIRQGRPGKPRPDEEPPRLEYDKDRSSGDLKTIVIRARHFKDAWCESLAAWLGKEYPFLWQLEVEP